MHPALILLALRLPLALAAPCPSLNAIKIIQQIAPGSKSCAEPRECRTAQQAAPFIFKSMAHYAVYNPKQMAAVIALMAFESVDFKYKHNVNPGRPGQGTANMQMAKFNLLYAKQIDGVKDKVAGIASVDGLGPEKLNYVLSLVQPDEYNFGSGPWFLRTQCGGDVSERLDGDVDEGFAAYMRCVGVDVTDERKAYFERAKKAFGLA